MKQFIIKLYDLLILLASNLRSLFLAAIRVTWGYHFFLTGRGKVGNIQGITDYFGNELHIPLPHVNAIMASYMEFIGGMLLMAGFASRFAAAGLTVVMCVAYATADRKGLESLDAFVKADPFPFFFACLVVLIFGPGRYSIDFLIQRFVMKRPDNTLPPSLPQKLMGN